jgi:hypothetical protein
MIGNEHYSRGTKGDRQVLICRSLPTDTVLTGAESVLKRVKRRD